MLVFRFIYSDFANAHFSAFSRFYIIVPIPTPIDAILQGSTDSANLSTRLVLGLKISWSFFESDFQDFDESDTNLN